MKATSLIRKSLVHRLGVVAVAAALLASAGALAPDAQAGVAFTGGSASADPYCHVNFGGNTTSLLGDQLLRP